MPISSTEAVVVLITFPASQDAAAFARTLVGEQLAACVNIVPTVRSVYRWQDAVHDELEQQIIVKTLVSALPRLEARVRELHPYDVPEFLALPVAAGAEAYLDWMASAVAG